MDRLHRQLVEGSPLNGRYTYLSPLNHGSFGMVVMAKDNYTGEHVAVKCLLKPAAAKLFNSTIAIDDRSEELAIHSRAGQHPNIVNLLDHFEDDFYNYLVLEYCSQGDLYEAIRQDKGPKKTDTVRDFMTQLIDAVSHLHSRGIFHRDIKPENIFLSTDGSMKLGDFGLASSDSWSYEIAVGSDRYMAPEQFDPAGNGLAPAKADIWSVGICLLNVLFSRNPFGEPAISDPLFADFVRDRQSLFDVFPNMSQDTFEILIHCLAIDPEKRSLELLRDALDRVVSFTTDDESLDDFCTEDREVVAATANREPLRTPSITSPNMDQTDSFPWAKALHLAAPQKRVLSVIPDTESLDVDHFSEDLFPASEASTQDWFSKADTISTKSTVDSGLGVSIGSTFHSSPMSRTRPVPIAGSMPSFGDRASSAIASIFGKKKTFESKSWSDLWDEEQEELEQFEHERAIRPFRPAKLSTLSQEDSEDDGRSTPRAVLAELKNPTAAIPTNKSLESLESRDDFISQHTGFIFEEHNSLTATPKYSPPAKRSFMDKWAALGERRRGANNTSSTADQASQPADPAKRKSRTSTWRRNMGMTSNRNQPSKDNAVWSRQEWNISRDWRRSDQHLPVSKPPPSQLDGASMSKPWMGSEEDWVIGGMKELQV